jgi:3-dehydroquinate synthase
MPLGTAAYDIVIGDGLLAELPALLRKYCPAAHYALISDTHVAPLYGERIRTSLAADARVSVMTFPAGEWNKTRETWSALTDQLLAAGIGRDGAVLALGGGVVGDIAGFVAATYLRGIPCVQIPTTLLAMIDSSVGGKTGVDTAAGKNLVGAFHQPRLVAIDVQTLSTLPKNQIAAGMAEALKHGAIADRNYFGQLESAREEIFARKGQALSDAVSVSVRIKAQVVAEDEKEHGRRATLNFGHTVGHAVEAASGYGLLHGEAISIGMAVEAAIGVKLGVTERTDAEKLKSTLQRFGLPTELPTDLSYQRLEGLMRQDKKVRAGETRFALIAGIGKMARGASGEWTIPVSSEVLKEMLLTTG